MVVLMSMVVDMVKKILGPRAGVRGVTDSRAVILDGVGSLLDVDGLPPTRLILGPSLHSSLPFSNKHFQNKFFGHFFGHA